MKKFRKPILVLILALLAVMTFAACNNKVELKISFIVDEEVYHTINTNGEEALKLPSDPEKEGYVFDGWFWDRDSWQKPFTANSLSNEPLSENRSVYAKWNDSNAVEGTQAKFDGFNETNASTYSIIVSNATELLNFSDVVEINNKSSWKLTTDIQGNNAIASKIATLTAGDNTYYVLVTADNGNVKLYTLQIRRKPLYLVSFNTSGGSTVASQTVEEGDFATEPTATRIGYNFVNWNFDFGNTPITSSMTIVADWAVQVYTITYRDVGDIAFSGTHGQGYPATHIFDTITQLVSPQKTGYIFDGWFISDDGNEMALTQLPPTDYTSDITLYAKWRSVPYIDENGESQLVSVSNLTELTISGNRTLTGWYLLSGTVSGNFTLTVSGEAHIILADNCEWVVNAGIIVTTGNELYIYAQSVGSTAGELSTNANIGGGNGYDSGEKGGDGGTITINGGTISATNIGGGNGRNGGSVLVIGPGGGEVDYAAGNGGDNGTITINGGTVSATNIGGGNGGNGGYFLPSGNVGDSGNGGAGGIIIINGGTISAINTGGGNGSNGGDSGTITVNGGTISATNIGGGNGGNGGDSGTITVNGGTISATNIGGGNGGIGVSVQVVGTGGNGGSGGDNETITINGGMISAINIGGGIGGNGGDGEYGTGGNGGNGGNGGTISISGGTISAQNIGSGSGGKCGTNIVILPGVGTIIIDSGTKGEMGESGIVVITGGSINATISDNPINAENESVFLIVVEVDAINAAVDSGIITGAEYYSFKDVTTNEDGKLYFWVPTGSIVVSITINDVVYPVNV